MFKYLNIMLHSARFGWARAIVRYRSGVLDGGDMYAVGGDRPYRRLAARAHPCHHHTHLLDPHLLGTLAYKLPHLGGGKGRTLFCPCKPQATGRRPRDHAALIVAKRDLGIIVGGLDV